MAVDALFAADIRNQSAIELLEQAASVQQDRQNQEEIVGYAKELVLGVVSSLAGLDQAISAFSRSWSLERMPAVDRAILRVATWEILENDSVPDPVAIAEAVELAKTYSTEDSGGFINGLLSAIAETKTPK